MQFFSLFQKPTVVLVGWNWCCSTGMAGGDADVTVSSPWRRKVTSSLHGAVLLGQLVGIFLFSFFSQVLEKVSSLLTCTYSCISACRIVNAVLTFPMLQSVTREEGKTQVKLVFVFLLFPHSKCLQTKLGNVWKIIADHLKLIKGKQKCFLQVIFHIENKRDWVSCPSKKPWQCFCTGKVSWISFCCTSFADCAKYTKAICVARNVL